MTQADRRARATVEVARGSEGEREGAAMAPVNRRVRPARPPVDPDAAAEAPRGSGSGAASRRPSPVWAALRAAVGFAFVAAASVGVAWFGRRQVTTAARFAIASIEVVGNERRPSAAIASESGLSRGTNIFAVDLDAARDSLLKDPWIVDAALVRRLPSTVVVRVRERKPAALVVLDETYLATEDGVPFKKLEPADPVDLPVVTGITADEIAADRDGATRIIGRAIDLAAEFERSTLGRRAPLEEVHVGADGAFTLVVGHGGMQLVLGGPPFRRKLDQASRVVAELERRGARADAVMLDDDVRPGRVVVRMR